MEIRRDISHFVNENAGKHHLEERKLEISPVIWYS